MYRKQTDIYTKSKDGENYYQVVIIAEILEQGYSPEEFTLEIHQGENTVTFTFKEYERARALFEQVAKSWMEKSP